MSTDSKNEVIEGDFDIKPDKVFDDEFGSIMDTMEEIPEDRRTPMWAVTLLVVGILVVLGAIGVKAYIALYVAP